MLHRSKTFRCGRCGGMEARDLTPWLAAHQDLLGKELQMDLELERGPRRVVKNPFTARRPMT